LKILFPLEYYYPSLIDGKGSTIYTFNKELSKDGLEINITSSSKGIELKDLDKNNLYLKHNLNVNFIKESFFSHINLKQIKIILKNEIIHFSSFFYKLTIFYFLIGIFSNKKIVISPRGEFYPPALKRKSLIKMIYINCFKIFQNKINFHATNEEEEKIIKRFFPGSKVFTIPNLINISKPLNEKKNNNLLFLGRINPIKNIDLLIEAYANLSAEIKSKFSLIIVGEAFLDYEKKYFKKLKVLIKSKDLNDKVKFLGPIYGNQKLKIISESYCLILPSKSENFGNVVLEAISQNTPVIASKNTPWKILKDNNAGYWISPTVDSINSTLNELILLDNKRYSKIQNSAMILLKNRFSFENNISLWKNYYSNL
jgi:glycosyltransferase involved in cell wall biosynthesis